MPKLPPDLKELDHKELPDAINDSIRFKGHMDLHNHWVGILPVEKFIELYSDDKPRKTTGDPFRKSKPAIGLAIDLCLRLLELQEQDPDPFSRRAKGDPWELGDTVCVLAVAYLAYILKYKVKNRGKTTPPETIKDLTEEVMKMSYQNYSNFDAIDISFAESLLKKLLRTSKVVTFDECYHARGELSEVIDKSLINTHTFDLLSEERIKYCEMSVRAHKIPIKDDGTKYLQEGSRIRWLHITAKHRKAFAGECQWTNEEIEQELQHTDTGRGNDAEIVGIDLAGPERYEYESKHVENTLKVLLDEMDKKNLHTLRIHLGEGSIWGPEMPWGVSAKTLLGVIWSNKDELTTKEGIKGYFAIKVKAYYPSRLFRNLDKPTKMKDDLKKRAQKNIDALLKAFENLKRTQPYTGKLQEFVIRLGHVTHITLSQAKKAIDMGLNFDVIPGSNRRTGVWGDTDAYQTTIEPPEGDVPLSLLKDERFLRWNESNYVDTAGRDKHGLINIIEAMRKSRKLPYRVFIGTDGQGSEGTSIWGEWLMVYNMIRAEYPREYDEILEGILTRQERYREDRQDLFKFLP